MDNVEAADVAVHAWDQARAIGADEQLDPRLVDHALEVMVPSAGALRRGRNGRMGPTDGSVPPQVRLLRLAGRQPSSGAAVTDTIRGG